jgi:TolB-like protein
MNRMHFCCAVVFVVLGMFSFSVYADEPVAKKKIAITKIESYKVSESFPDYIRNTLEMSLYNTDKFQLIDKTNTDKAAADLGQSGERNAESDKKLGGRLSTDFVISGSISRYDQYRIAARVTDVTTGEIIIAYAKEYTNEKDTDKIIDIITENITEDLLRYVRTGKLRKRLYDFNNIYIGLQLHYVKPLGYLDAMVNPGYGAALSSEVKNIFFRNLCGGVSIGYYLFSGKKNSTDSMTLAMLTADVSYMFKINERMALIPSVKGGAARVVLKHGTGDGFSMPENKESSAIEPVAESSLAFSFFPVEDIQLRLLYQYSCIFEKNQIIRMHGATLAVYLTF